MSNMNRRIVLAQRPQGPLTADSFRLEERPVPEPKEGQVLVRTVHLSVDPYIRGRLDKVRSYTKSIDVGGVIYSGTVSRVVESRHPNFQAGDWVSAYVGWQDYDALDTTDVLKLDPSVMTPSHALGTLGLSGFAAWLGLHEIARAKSGETFVVGAATGGVGAAAGQMAKLLGCRVVGIAGGQEKCDYAVRELGFDACANHHEDDLLWQLREACPKGIDIYFENLGGRVLDAVIPQLNSGARIPLCGLMAYYNHNPGDGVDRTAMLMASLLVKRARLEGFNVHDYMDHHGPLFMKFFNDTRDHLISGKIKALEHRVAGLENAPQALMDQLQGKNFGKVVVDV